jgi:hypothetical protein
LPNPGGGREPALQRLFTVPQSRRDPVRLFLETLDARVLRVGECRRFMPVRRRGGNCPLAFGCFRFGTAEGFENGVQNSGPGIR